MSIRVSCTSCGHTYSVKDEHAGRSFRCKDCSTPVRVPASEPETGEFGSVSNDDEFGQYDQFGSPSLATQARRRKRKAGSDEKTSREKKNKAKDHSGPNVKLLVTAASAGGVLLIGSGVLVAILIVRQANTPYARREAIEKEARALYTDLVVALEKVDGKDRAKEAAEEVDRVRAELEKLLERQQKIPALTRAEEDKLRKAYEPDGEALRKRAEAAVNQIGGYLVREPSFMAAWKRLVAFELKAMRIQQKRYDESK